MVQGVLFELCIADISLHVLDAYMSVLYVFDAHTMQMYNANIYVSLICMFKLCIKHLHLYVFNANFEALNMKKYTEKNKLVIHNFD